MIELSFAITNKKSGKEVYRSKGKFESLESFFHYVATKYGYTSRNYDFTLSGRTL